MISWTKQVSNLLVTHNAHSFIAKIWIKSEYNKTKYANNKVNSLLSYKN